MDPETARFLTSDAGRELLEAARSLRDRPPLGRRRALEGRADPARLRAVLGQDDLRRRAAPAWPEAERLVLTREGLEQATAWALARERTTRWPASLDVPLVDLGAGIGADALATALSGRPVQAWERDPVRALLLEHNARALGVADRVLVLTGNVREGGPRGRLAFFDPDRRPGGRRTRDPDAFEPPQTAWNGLLEPFEAAMVKLPPTLEAVAGAEDPFEVVSLGGRLRERRLLRGRAFAPAAPRAALALPSGQRVDGAGLPWPSAGGVEVGAWLLDPDGAVTVAGLVGDLAIREGLVPVHPRIAYLVGSRPAPAPGHWIRVKAILPARPAAIDRWLSAEDVGSLTLRSRGLADPVATWRKRLHPRGKQAATIVLTRDRRDRWVAYAGEEHSGAMTCE